MLADTLRMEQVLNNLLENAARYSDPSSPVAISVVAEDGHAVLSVADHGDGIPEAELEQVFEPFYRGRNAKRRGIRGAGLGLAICRGIVEAHGGRIGALNRPGGGFDINIVLPIVTATGAPGTTDRAPVAARTASGTPDGASPAAEAASGAPDGAPDAVGRAP